MKQEDVRKAFRSAEGGAVPEVDRLVDAVPSLMARARRAAPASWWPAVPRLAALTALAVVVAVALTLTSKGTQAAAPSTFEKVMLGTGGSSGTGDLLLDAVLNAGRSDG